MSMVDRVETVTDEESIAMAHRLSREEGILSGISCGAAATVALRIAQEDAFAGKTIVVVLPDSGERYLSSALFADAIWFHTSRFDTRMFTVLNHPAWCSATMWLCGSPGTLVKAGPRTRETSIIAG